MAQHTLKLFKVLVVSEQDKVKAPNTTLIKHGLVLDFIPTRDQVEILKSVYKPLDITTLFTRHERDNADIYHLIGKQLLHYVEVYGLNRPGLFNLEVNDGQLITMNYIRGVTVDELGSMVQELLYKNAPIGDSDALKEIINHYKITYDINKIENNEMRMLLFNQEISNFEGGDDAVRFICYNATKDALLIKSREVIEKIKEHKHTVSNDFLLRHELQLAQVFNRHKRIILAIKTDANKSIINRISRLSKSEHVPIIPAINKTFIAKALSGEVDTFILEKIGLRDKFKYLNLLEYKMLQHTDDMFRIRNGKVFIKEDRKVANYDDVEGLYINVRDNIIHEVSSRLKGQNILLDPVVHYGLPISRKQVFGNLPIGTKVITSGERISAGMYWENAGGAYDLDLSVIDDKGNRTGWGTLRGYDRNNPITFSGDITSAPEGAMEFITSPNNIDYGMFINIYTGDTGCETEIVIGEDNDDEKWISNPIIREKITLGSKNMIVGIVKKNEFVAWQGRSGSKRFSTGGVSPFVSRGFARMWTVNELLTAAKVSFDIEKDNEKTYDHVLTYDGFSFDKLENLLLAN